MKDEALRDLIERVEQATEGSRELDFAVIQAALDAEPGPLDMHTGEPLFLMRGLIVGCDFYTASLDAAMSLVGDDCFRVERHPMYGVYAYVGDHDAYAATPALALVVASLRAHMGTGG